MTGASGAVDEPSEIVDSSLGKFVAPEPDDVVVQSLMKAFGYTEDEAIEDVRRTQFANSLFDSPEMAHLSEAIGGLWIDRKDGMTVRVAVTTDEAEKLLGGLGLPDWVVVSRVRFSRMDLRDWSMIISEELRRQRKDDENFRVSLDDEHNRLMVRANSDHLMEVAREIQAKLGQTDEAPEVLVSRLQGEGFRNVSCPIDCGNVGYISAGMHISRPGAGDICTTGFSFVKDGVRRSSTAGHCGSGAWKNGPSINSQGTGPTIADSLAGFVIVAHRADYQLLEPRPGRTPDNDVWHQGGWRDVVTKVVNPNNFSVGTWICRFGSKTHIDTNGNGTGCGALMAVFESSGYEWDYGVIGVSSKGGDSGGPVYELYGSGARALGLTRGTTDWESSFSWVPIIENYSQSSLITS